MPEFVLPNAADRTTVIGPTGSGKTVFAGLILSKQNFEKRPWVLLDFKDEELWDLVKSPPIQTLKIGDMPGKRGLYRMYVDPQDDEAIEQWLRKIWARGNTGLFIDEQSLMPKGPAMKAILRQGRSKLIPCIMCTQRPVDCDREVFTESQYISVFSIEDEKDLKTVRGYTRNSPIEAPLPSFHSWWYDRRQKFLFRLQPSPPPDMVASLLRQVAPVSWWNR